MTEEPGGTLSWRSEALNRLRFQYTTATGAFIAVSIESLDAWRLHDYIEKNIKPPQAAKPVPPEVQLTDAEKEAARRLLDGLQ